MVIGDALTLGVELTMPYTDRVSQKSTCET